MHLQLNLHISASACVGVCVCVDDDFTTVQVWWGFFSFFLFSPNMHTETPYLARHKDLHTSKAWGMDQTQQLQVVHSSLCVALLPSSVALFMSVPPEATFRCNT